MKETVIRSILKSIQDGTIPKEKGIDLCYEIKNLKDENEGTEASMDVAVIGMSGKYPGAENLKEYWENLKEGKDCVTEIPADRWIAESFYESDPEEARLRKKSYSKWGGFLKDIDKFDPLFFRISPGEAQLMDPQERLFLESAWDAIEDSGYTREELNNNDNKVGVYVGAAWQDYQFYSGGVNQAYDDVFTTSGYNIANRVSYFCDFKGSSLTVNTACSSSLIAIHLACQSLIQGENSIALAGGVNLCLHTNKYVTLSTYQFLSSQGKCDSFGEGAEGYVPGEGVGCVILKPLKDAVKAHDHIYGVIKGSAANHGGKTNGYSVPSPKAQAEVIRDALKRSNVNAREISYIEAHGTGTSLGDPIEIAGLQEAFESYTHKKQFCRIGSVKSNIGHCESAAGIASLEKVLLQIKYQQIVPSIHAKVLNPNIKFEDTAFLLQRETKPWQKPVLINGETQMEYPRTAGISSFGAGGSNAHIIVQEYEEEVKSEEKEPGPFLMVFSARTKEQLKRKAEMLISELNREQYEDAELRNMAYTLQIGREAMAERMGMIISSIEDLKQQLAIFTRGNSLGEEEKAILIGQALKGRKEKVPVLSKSELLTMFKEKKYRELVALWVNGVKIDWNLLYGENKPYRISMPGYPYEKEHCWVHTKEEEQKVKQGEEDVMEESESDSSISPDLLQDKTIWYLKHILAPVIKLSADKLDEKAMLEEYGIDSIMIGRLTKELEKEFGTLSKTLFFEYQTIEELADYFLEDYKEVLINRFGMNFVMKAETEKAKSIIKCSENKNQKPVSHISNKKKDIAVIGMSGRYPGARNMKEFWKVLSEGKDCITEIPSSRWDYHLYYDEDKEKPGKTYAKWGGFIDGVDEFDPLFFNITPREAERMDPQERLILESTYETLEDAGYTPKTLVKSSENHGTGDVGVFIGVTNEEYQFFGVESQMQGKHPFSVVGSPATISSRVSYVFNFHGPSMSLDTMCSSSLTAIHLACQSIQSGECRTAVAGGVNVSIHPNKYLLLGEAKFASSSGRCESFGCDGDGYVPGEGVGTVLLKSLEEAVADGDHIYGVIKAAVVNHGGKTNGYTVPNPNAQAKVIREALDQAVISARDISYIEAHGTGTSLGDPIEITGLKKAFSKDTKEKQFCAIGSAKSNIGHCESAAGIAGIAKVLLQLKYKKLVPSLHSEVLNPNINFADTPFVVQHNISFWNTPVVERDGIKKQLPRIAGISSFGAGGTNAHVLIEEFVEESEKENASLKENAFLLSAKSQKQLETMAKQLLDAVSDNQYKTSDMNKIAYTLQMGREAFEYRMAVTASTIEELAEGLRKYLLGEVDGENVFAGSVKKNKETLDVFLSDAELLSTVTEWIRQGRFSKAADLWVKGLDIKWEEAYDGSVPGRISLPTYSFLQDHYWVDMDRSNTERIETGIVAKIHPLLQRNCSDFFSQRFCSVFTGNEKFFITKAGEDRHMLPGVSYLEMIRAAIETSARISDEDDMKFCFKNVTCLVPFELENENKELLLELKPVSESEISFQVINEEENTVCYCKGTGLIEKRHITDDVLELEKWENPDQSEQTSKEQLSEQIHRKASWYGNFYPDIEVVYAAKGKMVVKLKNVSESEESKAFFLNPGMLEGALLAVEQLMSDGKYYPVSIEEVKIGEKCTDAMWVVIQIPDILGEQVPEIKFYQENGKFSLSLKNIVFKKTEDENQLLLLEPCWKQTDGEKEKIRYERQIVVLAGISGKTAEVFRQNRKEAEVYELKCENGTKTEVFMNYAEELFHYIQQIMTGKPTGCILIQVLVPLTLESRIFMALNGLLKTAAIENTFICPQMILADETAETGYSLIEKLSRERNYPSSVDIKYEKNVRWVRTREKSPIQEKKLLPWRDKGIYLITGGTGKLGFIFAEEISKNTTGAVIILTGRTKPTEDKQEQIKKLRALGADVRYMQLDVSNFSEVKTLLSQIDKEFHSLSGILHCAGIIRDNFMIKKTKEEFNEVLKAKVLGMENLDTTSSQMNLDFFAAFSSIAACTGNIGQADYSTANAFLDGYASYRNELVREQKRYGRTLSINWSLWQDGGMKTDSATRKTLFQHMGIIPLETNKGLEGFYRAYAGCADQVMVIEGKMDKMLQYFLTSSQTKHEVKVLPAEDAVEETEEIQITEVLKDKVRYHISQIFNKITKLSLEQLEEEESFEEFGIDSIMITELNQELTQVLGELSKTLLFEYHTIKELTEYLVTAYPERCKKWVGMHEVKEAKTDCLKMPESKQTPEKKTPKHNRFSFLAENESNREPIAIIGLAGKYPQADNIWEFWNNLENGKDCITEIPKNRWSLDGFYYPDRKEAMSRGMSYSKWGGFIQNFDQFEPLFFNISPVEARNIDPQERLFMQTVWEAVEDAGYTRKTMEQKYHGSVGVFVGITKEGFGLHGERLRKQKLFPYTSFASVANRISYLLNFHGPSMAVDTMCSSSLTAIHEACNHIYLGDCEMAVAGGVNLYLHPMNYIHLCLNNMLSDDGKCRSYGKNGNGFVPGEGVGAVLLKPLSKAVNDKDHIYGVIRGTQINHGGRTNGYTVPNPNAIADAVEKAAKKAGISPRAISYVEGHGTGTALGDPIEINGLKKAFEKYSHDRQFCAIGSSKSNIGHCESAAGIAGVTKILLQMKYKKLVPSLNSEELNENIDFIDSPFCIQHECQPWKKPIVCENGVSREYKRTAGISSLGAGGSNAYMILEEYEREGERRKYMADEAHKAVIVLSARQKTSLKRYVKNLLDYIQSEPLKQEDLMDMAYTLQTGREPMEERLAVVTSSIAELKTALNAYLKEEKSAECGLFTGNMRADKASISFFKNDEDFQDTLDHWMQKGKNRKLAEVWVKGMEVEWEKLYGEDTPYRISLPVYPFETESFWFEENSKMQNENTLEANQESHENLEENQNETDKISILKEVLNKTLGVKKIQPDDSYSGMGGDSIKAIAVVSMLNEYNYQITAEQILTLDMVSDIAQAMKTRKNRISQEPETGKVELLPVQSCFFEHDYKQMNCWNTCITICNRNGINENYVKQIFTEIVKHHDALRMSFRKEGENYIQTYRSVSDKLYEYHNYDLRSCKEEEESFEKKVNELQYSIDLENGPLVHIVLFKRKQKDQLTIIIHHLVCDFISVQIICEDFITAYEQLMAGKKIQLPKKTNSLKEWSKSLSAYAMGDKIKQELPYWSKLDHASSLVERLPRDYIGDYNLFQYKEMADQKVSAEVTKKLLAYAKGSRDTSMTDLLLLSLGMTLEEWSGNSKLLVCMAGNGRGWNVGELDISRTVGWISVSYPVLADLGHSDQIEGKLEAVRQALHNIPDQGAGYDIIRYITLPKSTDEEKFKASPEIFFNYLGVTEPEEENVINHWTLSSDDARAENSDLVYNFDIRVMVVKDEIYIRFIFSNKVYNPETVKQLVKRYAEKLKETAQYLEGNTSVKK